MKKIEAYIRHEAFEPIRMELLTLGFPSLSISEVKGSGRQKGITERYRGAELTNYLRPKVKLECVVADRDVQTIVDTILKHARTGAVGDGKVFVLPVEESYRVRTGESGEEVLQAHPEAGGRHDLGRRGFACPRRRDLKGSPPPRAAAQEASSSGCAPFTSRWSTPSWAATASTRWRRSRPTPRARPWRSSSRASAPRWRRRRPARRTSRRCAATSPIASRTARRRCRRRSAPRCRSCRATTSSAPCSC